MEMKENNQKKVLLSVLGVAILVVAVIGISFAAYSTVFTSNANTVNEQAGEMLNGEVAFRGALDICKQSDASRGVDTADSDLGWLDDLMIKSSTPIALYVKENSNTIGDSQVALLRDKTTGIAVREQITLGRANRGESQTESFRHEYAHTVF